MFNFYVVSAGHDMVTGTGRATTCGRKFKAPWLQTKVQKMKDLPKTWVLTGKSSNISHEKKIKYTSSIDQTTPWNTRSLNKANYDGPCNQEEMNYRRNEKSIQVKTVGNLQD